MSDEVTDILQQQMRPAPSALPASPEDDAARDAFDEAGYLQAYPDVASAIASGAIASGYDHYSKHGHREGRRLPVTRATPRGELLTSARTTGTASRGPALQACDRVLISPGGGVLVIGWVNDAGQPIVCVQVSGDGWRLAFDGPGLMRSRRMDVEKAISSAEPYHFGYTAFDFVGQKIEPSAVCWVEVLLENGQRGSIKIEPSFVDDAELRNVMLGHLSNLKFFGNATVEAMTALGRHCGQSIIALNRAVSSHIVASPYVERFGPAGPKKGSIVVCLYGKPEYLFLQSALFGGRPGIEDYEFIYVSNSPELSETLLRDARSCATIYGLSITLVLLPGNAGFGAANNVAVTVARSDRILNVNPDVFPRDLDWARKHTSLIENANPAHTRLFGVPLYYDDGSLMHAGMYFVMDTGLSLRPEAVERTGMMRVEHYGKGAPPDTEKFVRPRPVPAVTGAFISSDRAWYERLGGFTEDYVFGHYEDADLCLKSIAAGTAPYLQDLRLWHLEGKGSVRQQVHEGGSLVNRWLFLDRWSDMLADGLLGPEPSHPLFRPTRAPVGAEPSAGIRPMSPETAPAKRAAGLRRGTAAGRG